MAVFRVSVTAPNGNSRSRPVVTATADDALADWRQEISMDEHDLTGFTFEIAAIPDPDGQYERALLRDEQRRLEDAFYAMPGMRSRRRR